MKTPPQITLAIAVSAVALIPAAGSAQTVVNGDNNNNLIRQGPADPSVLGTTFNLLGGNDRLILLRNDDQAGLGNGAANMGDGRDVVVTSFNMSGTFNLGGGNDFFLSEGDVNFNSNGITDILLSGGPGNDIIAVTTDFCVYAGDQGNDVFISDGSRNGFNGGDGFDTYSAELAESAATIDLLQGFALARFTTGETLVSIENARGSRFDDEIHGDGKPNRLDGLGGNDAISGDAGNDTIAGGPGANILEGGAGLDTLVIQGSITSKTRINPTTIRVVGSMGNAPFDHTASGFEQVLDNGMLKSVAFFMREANVNQVQPTVIGETPGLPAAEGFVNGRTLNGNGQANTIAGGPGHDDIAGFAGDDILSGLGGDDFIAGGDGNDKIEGGEGHDVLSGGGQNDLMAGGPGNDILEGGPGNDVLAGGPGFDKLVGGTNNDVFVFNTPLPESADAIPDYSVIDDTIRIAGGMVGGLPPGPLAIGLFKNTAMGPVDADDRIIYVSASGELVFDNNGSAEGGRMAIAKLPPNLPMVAAEIQIQ